MFSKRLSYKSTGLSSTSTTNKLEATQLTGNCHVARLVWKFEFRSIARHLAAVGARRLAAQVVQMDRAEVLVTNVIGADVNSLDTENHVLLTWHQRRVPAMHSFIKYSHSLCSREIKRKLLELTNMENVGRWVSHHSRPLASRVDNKTLTHL